jgi:hypothetical protein
MASKLLDKLKIEKKKDENEPEYPLWVLAGPPVTKNLFNAVNELFIELKKRIERSDTSNIDINNGPIVKAHIAERADVSPTNIRIDRQVDLFDHIDTQNKKLLRLLKKEQSTKSAGKRPTYKELKAENKKLESKIKKLEQDKYHDFFTQLIDSQVMRKQKDLALQNNKLLNEVTEYEDTIRNLRRQVSQYMKQLNNT